MFADEMEYIDRALAVDSAFRRKGQPASMSSRYANRHKLQEENPTRGQRDITAAFDRTTGEVWSKKKKFHLLDK